jgi:alcohol dehydrogenase class IV
MRPMKLAGSQLMFGAGCLEYLKTLPYKRVFIVTGGGSMRRSGTLAKVETYLAEPGAKTAVFEGVEADPSFLTAQRGAWEMRKFEPDLILALGGGSAMDAAKLMWVLYEHPEIVSLEQVLNAVPFPPLRKKARLACIPSTAGTASEVSRSFVITGNDGQKHGFGNMEMMPDIAICDPSVTVSMPPRITAETGMDAMTHALEALVSNRANYMSAILCERAIVDIYNTLPAAYENGGDMAARETMLNASMIAGMAFTNVSLGIVHSIAHAVGGMFHLSHGLSDAVILPHVVRFNRENSDAARALYDSMAEKTGQDIESMIHELNRRLGIPHVLSECIPDKERYVDNIEVLASQALADGCTKTNPVIPSPEQMRTLLLLIYDNTET